VHSNATDATQRCTSRQAVLLGFTLIELLVVISIISMLMSISLPSLSRAREAGKRIVCASNLRQLTIAWEVYASDNEQRLCSADTYWNDESDREYWVADGPVLPSNDIGGTKWAIQAGALWPYTEHTLELYKCRSDNSPLLRSYSISNRMGGRMRDGIKPFKSLAEITRASEKAVFVDAGTQWAWIVDGFWPIDLQNGQWLWQNSDFHNITARHADGCNMSFTDLHCEYVKWKDRRTEKFAYWAIDPGQASVGNRDLERVVRALVGK